MNDISTPNNNVTIEQLQKLLEQADKKLSQEQRIEDALIKLEKLEGEIQTANQLLASEKILSTYYVDNYVGWTSMILTLLVVSAGLAGNKLVQKYIQNRVDEKIDTRIAEALEPIQEQTTRNETEIKQVEDEQKKAADRQKKEYELLLKLYPADNTEEKVHILTEEINKETDGDYLAVLHDRRGYYYGELGEHQKSLIDYNEAIELNPQHSASYYNRAVCIYTLTQNEHDTIKDLAMALKLNHTLHEQVKQNPIFEYLHNNIEFCKLLGI